MSYDTFKLVFLSKVDPYKFTTSGTDKRKCENPNFKGRRLMQIPLTLPSSGLELLESTSNWWGSTSFELLESFHENELIRQLDRMRYGNETSETELPELEPE